MIFLSGNTEVTESLSMNNDSYQGLGVIDCNKMDSPSHRGHIVAHVCMMRAKHCRRRRCVFRDRKKKICIPTQPKPSLQLSTKCVIQRTEGINHQVKRPSPAASSPGSSENVPLLTCARLSSPVRAHPVKDNR